MKNLLYLAVFIAFFSCRENSPSGEEATSGGDSTSVAESADGAAEKLQELKTVEDIKNEYSSITSKIENGSIDSTSFEYNCRDEKKGKVTYFSEGGQLRKIKHTYNEYSHFSATDEYFIKNDSLFFVFYNHLVWNFIDQEQTKDEVTEKRFYIIDNKPVKCLQKKSIIISPAKVAPQSTTAPNKEIECPSLEPVLADFNLFFGLRNQKEALTCLEK